MKKQTMIIGLLIFYLEGYSQSIGLEKILKRIEDKNPQIKVKELDVEIKEKERKKSLKNLILPPISIKSENDWEISRGEKFGNRKIEATVPLFQGGKSINVYKKSNSELELVKTEKNLATYSLQIIGISEYFLALNYKKQSEITELATLVLQKKKNKLDNLYKKNKVVPKSEVLKIEAAIENNKAINFENIRKERMARKKLIELLGYELDEQIIIDEFDMEGYLKFTKEIKKIKDFENTTLGKKQNLILELAEYDVKIAKADLYPALYVKSSHVFKKENTKTNRDKNINEGRIEVGITYIFAWGGTLDSVEQSQYRLEQAKIKYENNTKKIGLDISYKLKEIESFIGQSVAQKKRMELLKENLKIDNLRYDNELITTFDYLNSVNQLKIAEEDFYKLQRALVLATIEYENLYK